VRAHAPGGEAIVEIWERGRREHPIDRALTVLSVLAQHPRRELAELSLERRDQLLVQWRSRLFGSEMVGYDECPRCGCGVEVAVTAPEPDDTADGPFEVEIGGHTLLVRMPTSLDLAAIADCESVEAASRVLVERCVKELPSDDEFVRDEELVRIVERELDRRAGVSGAFVTADCPECSHRWRIELDVAAFAWREIELLAVRLLGDVDALARRYGWSEHEILSLSSARRHFYLELVP
jgi:hypothetical protein